MEQKVWNDIRLSKMMTELSFQLYFILLHFTSIILEVYPYAAGFFYFLSFSFQGFLDIFAGKQVKKTLNMYTYICILDVSFAQKDF